MLHRNLDFWILRSWDEARCVRRGGESRVAAIGECLNVMWNFHVFFFCGAEEELHSDGTRDFTSRREPLVASDDGRACHVVDPRQVRGVHPPHGSVRRFTTTTFVFACSTAARAYPPCEMNSFCSDALEFTFRVVFNASAGGEDPSHKRHGRG